MPGSSSSSSSPGRIEQIRDKALNDHLFFCKEILGFDRAQPEPHGAIQPFIETSKKRKHLFLMPRNSFKSSIVTVGYTLWRIVKNPNIRIFIASETQRNAIKYGKEIKSHIETNLRFRALFGDMRSYDNTWRDNEFIVKNRTRIKKESTVTTGSLEKGTSVGMHYDLVILDDVVSRNNVGTPEQIEKTKDYYKLLLSILDPDGDILVVGTRWHLMDMYGWMQDKNEPEHENIDLFYRSAEKEGGEPAMPKILSKEFLAEQRKTQGQTIYNAQYLNKAISADNATFNPDQINFYEDSPDGLFYFMTLDPAISQSSNSDYTGIIVNGVDWEGKWWIQEALGLRLNPSEIVEKVFELGNKYSPMMALGMEKFALEKMLMHQLQAEMQRRKKWFVIKELQTSTRVSKEARIRALEPVFEQGKLHIKREMKELHRQIVSHPQVKHDDILDALKSQIQIVFPSDKKPTKTAKTAHLSWREKEIWDEVEGLGRKKRKVRSRWGYSL